MKAVRPGRWPAPRWRRTAGLAAAAVLLLGLVAWLGGRGSPPAAGVKRWLGVGAVCGNGQVESGEECDDGNPGPADRCLPSCRLASCGDGQIRTHVEECDDGNQVDNDGCSRSCLTCPAGSDSFSSPHTGHCYWRQPDSLSFSDAAANCARDGGNLVTFADDDEWREVTERLLAGGNSPPMWIGLRREERNGLREFGWVTGERVLSAHWGIQEPRRSPANLDCGLQGEAGAWATSGCDEPHSFVCERPGWSVYPRDGHAYRRFVERVQWEEAQAAVRRPRRPPGHVRGRGRADLRHRRLPGHLLVRGGLRPGEKDLGMVHQGALDAHRLGTRRTEPDARPALRGRGRRPPLVQPGVRRPPRFRLRSGVAGSATGGPAATA